MDNDKTIIGKLETIKHIHKVRENLYKVIELLDERARNHDLTKLESPEAEIFGEHTPELAKTEYGSEDYKKLLEKVKPAIDHHYSKNRHHPEHWKNGINDFDLIDLIELLCDWRASSERNKNGNIKKSIELNKVKYGLSDQLVEMLENTVERYF